MSRGHLKHPLWTCPACGEQFTTPNQWHSCGVFDVDALFDRSMPHVRATYDAFVAVMKSFGPLRVIPQRSRIALQVRMRFAALMPQKSALKGHLVLASTRRSRHFVRVDTLSPRNHVHVFRLVNPGDIDGEFRSLMGEAYKVGEQLHVAGSQMM